MLPTGLKRKLANCAAGKSALGADDALSVLLAAHEDLPEVFAAASAVRRRRFGKAFHLCSIQNARSGACQEDCSFCAQSAHHGAGAEVYDLQSADELAAAYSRASRLPIRHFSIVTSGNALIPAEVAQVCRAIRQRSIPGVAWCGSLGSLSAEALRSLKSAGMTRYHHNMETAESFFPRICTTHTWQDRLATVRAARAAGLEVCSGGLFGLGETLEQRVELALALARESVDSIPLNFLIPVPGTPLADRPKMSALEILRTIAMFRLTNPLSEIRLCGGRGHLGELQPLAVLAGASGMMVGPLLTTPGRDLEQDFRMLAQLEVEYAR